MRDDYEPIDSAPCGDYTCPMCYRKTQQALEREESERKNQEQRRFREYAQREAAIIEALQPRLIELEPVTIDKTPLEALFPDLFVQVSTEVRESARTR